VFNLGLAVTGLTTAMQKNVGQLLTLQGDEIAWRQSLQAAEKQLDSNSAGLSGNSAKALANKAAVLAATNQVITFAGDQLKLGGNMQGASRRIAEQITWLQKHGDKSKFAAAEIRALRLEEDKLKAVIRQRLLVTASGFWKVTGALPGGTPQPGTHPVARGWLVSGGIAGKDSVPILAMPGEAVVPRHLTPAIAPLMKAAGVPGFAAGGVVASYGNALGGLGKWLGSEDRATLRAVDRSTAAAVVAAMKGMGGGGALGGDAAASKALAARMFPFASSQWAPFVALEMAEAGFSRFARNASSGAYGIPQALPPSKMPFAAQAAGGSHAGPQLAWMFSYIASRWGSPANAEANELRSHWYDSGVQYLPRGASIAVNNTGRPERVGGEDLAPLLRETNRLLRQVCAITGGVGGDVAGALNGVARMSASRAAYSAR
jgi:hypothetical protein